MKEKKQSKKDVFEAPAHVFQQALVSGVRRLPARAECVENMALLAAGAMEDKGLGAGEADGGDARQRS